MAADRADDVAAQQVRSVAAQADDERRKRPRLLVSAAAAVQPHPARQPSSGADVAAWLGRDLVEQLPGLALELDAVALVGERAGDGGDGPARRTMSLSIDKIAVVDGDTIDVGRVRYRMIGYDTPESSTPRRRVGPKERALAYKATRSSSASLHPVTIRVSASGDPVGEEKSSSLPRPSSVLLKPVSNSDFAENGRLGSGCYVPAARGRHIVTRKPPSAALFKVSEPA
jgi:hypothetical protein